MSLCSAQLKVSQPDESLVLTLIDEEKIAIQKT